MKKIMLLNANPAPESFSTSCSNRYEKTAKELGAEVRRFDIDKMDFDPVLHQGYKVIQELEPILIKWQEAVKWADILVFIYPNWWNTMPAKMKGIFDRSLLPKFAFKFENNKMIPLLNNKSGTIINIVGSCNPILLQCKIGNYTNELSHGILGTCGVKPVRVYNFGATRSASNKNIKNWLNKVEKIAKRDVS